MQAGATVLVIDDEPDLLELTRMALEMGGFRVVGATTGEEALELLAGEPDVILLDIRLPGISGWEVLDRLAENARAVRVIPISAHTSETSFARALEMGCLSYITKPFRTADLLQTVRDALDQPPPVIRRSA